MKTKFSKRILSLFLAVMMVVTTIPMFTITASAATDNDMFLFAYFTGDKDATANDSNTQAIRFATSRDGINFKALRNNEALLKSTLGTKNVRDPYLFKGKDGAYYIIATDLDASKTGYWGTQSGMIVWKSTDLVNWTNETRIDVGEIIGVDPSLIARCWAPEVLYDSSLGAYMVYFALGVEPELADRYKSTTMYYMTTTDLLDQSKYSKPQQLYDNSANNADAIDADIIKQNDTYYMFYKDEGQGTVSLATSNNVTGPYSFVGKFATSSKTGNIEGCEVYMVGSNYYLIADRYSAKGKFAIYNLGTDLSQLTNKGTSISVTDGNPITTVEELEGFSNLSARHGSVAKISYDEYKYIMQEIEGKTIHDEVYYNFNRDYSATSWAYDAIQDSSGFSYDLMTGYDGATKSGGSATYTFANANYVSLYGSNIFINDHSAKEIMAGNSWTVSYDYVCAEKTNAAVFTLTSGPSKTNTDWIRINDNGDLWYHDGSKFNRIGEEGAFVPVEGVSYHIDIVYDGSKIYFYADGELIGTVAAANIGYDYTAPTNYISFGGSDGNKNSFRGAFSNIRFKSEALSQNEINYSYENSASLVYNYNQGTEYIDGRAYTTKASSQISDTYTNSKGKSMIYSVCAWINPGSSVGGTNTIFQFGDGGTGSGKNYFEIDENGQYWYCWDYNGMSHYYDGSGAFGSAGLSANKWYFLQVNIIPYKNSTKFIFYLNGVNTATLDGTTVASGNNFTGFDYNPIYFFNRTSMHVYYGSGNAHWSGDGSSYIDDVRVYNKTVNPTVVYTAAAAHAAEELAEYEQANALKVLKTDIDGKLTSDSYRGQMGYTVTAAADGSYNTSKLTGYKGQVDKMSNVLYTYGVGSKSPKSSEVHAGDNKIYMQYGNIVFLYDGTNEMCTPINFHNGVSTTGGKKRVRYVIPTTPSELSIANYWHTTSGSKTATYITGNDIYANNVGSTDCNNNKHQVFYSSTLKLNLPDSFTDNYKTIDSVKYKFEDGDGVQGTVTMSGSSISAVNYKPLVQIFNGTTKPTAKVLTNDGFYSFYKKVKANEDWLYTYESTKKYYEAVNNIVQFDVTSYDYASNPSGKAQEAGKKISALATAYKNAVEGLTPKTYNVSFTDINGTVTNNKIDAGSKIGTFPSNTSIKYNNDKANHTTYSWDTTLTSDSVVKSDIDIVEKSTKSKCSFSSSVTTEATCTANGERTYTCSTCGGKYYETIDELGHNFATYSANYTKDQTFDSSKTYEHTSTCTRCDATDTKTCTFGAYETTVEPTLTTDGVETATCSTCSGTVTRVIPKLGATTYTISFYDKDGNFIESASVEENTMPVAPQLPADFVDSAGTHNYAWSPEIVVATANASYQVVDNLTPHTNFTQEVTAPTCTEQGYTTYTCGGGCGYSYKADYVDALGHDYTGVDYVDNNNGTHSRACTRGDYTETEACSEYSQTVIAPNCTEAGYTLNTCEHCGYSYKSDFTTATGHNPGTAVEENRVEPTCTVAGSYDSVVYCQNENCTLTNKEYSRETISIPATGHSFVNTHVPATCTAAGYWSSKCSVCGEENGKIDYTFNANSECSTKYPSIANGSSSTQKKTYEYIFTFDTQPSAPVEIVNMEVVFDQFCHKGVVNHADFSIYDANGAELYKASNYTRDTEQYNQKITVTGNYFKIVTNSYFNESEDHILFSSIKVRPKYPALGHSEAYRDDNNSTDSNLGTHSRYCTRCNEVLATSNHDIVTSVVGNTVVANCSTCGFSKVISTQKDTYRITTGNLFDFAVFANSDSVNMGVSGGSSTVSTADNSITLTGIGDSYTYFSNTGNDNVYKIPVTPNKSYTIEFKATTTAADVMIFQPNADGTGSNSNYYNQLGYRFGHKVGLNTTTITPTSDYIFMRFGTQTTTGRIDYTKIYDIAVYEAGANVEVASDVPSGTTFANAVSSVNGNAYLDNFCNWGVAGDTLVTSNMNVTPVAHTVVTDSAVKETCTTDGYTEGSHCSTCNTVLVAQKFIPMLGHDERTVLEIKNRTTYIWYTECSRGDKKEQIKLIDVSAYNAAVEVARTEIENTGKYTEESRNELSAYIHELDLSANSTLTADTVQEYTTALVTATNIKNGDNGGVLELMQYSVTFKYVLDDTPVTVIDNQYYKYGDIVQMSVDKSTGSVCKWTMKSNNQDMKYASECQTVSYIVKENAEFYAYLQSEPITSEGNFTVTVLNKLGKVAGYLYVPSGESINVSQVADSTDVKVSYDTQSITLSKTAFYQITGFKVVNGKEITADGYVVTGDVTLVPVYSNIDAIIITLGNEGISFKNNSSATSKPALWDEKVIVKTNDNSSVTWFVDDVAVAYGPSYTFRAVKSITITTQSGITEQGSSKITYYGFDNENNKARIIASSYSSETFKIKEQGLYIVTSTDVNKTFTEADMANAKKYKATNSTDTGDQFSFTLSISSTSSVKAFGVKSYVIYEGSDTPIFSDEVVTIQAK